MSGAPDTFDLSNNPPLNFFPSTSGLFGPGLKSLPRPEDYTSQRTLLLVTTRRRRRRAERVAEPGPSAFAAFHVSFPGDTSLECVGKSSLVHLLCQNQVLGNPSWTVGCSVDVRVHDYKEGTPEEKTYYIELWDVGGSVGSASSVKSTRAVFYNSVNGIILVHDLTNKKSSQNLYRWSLEALNRDSVPTGVLVTNGDYDREQFADNQIPLLVIGTKLDQIHETKRHEVLTRTAFLAEDFNAEEINLDCTNPRYLAAGSSNAVKLSRFFDKVIEKRYFLREGNQIPGFPDRKRFGAGTLKSLHYD
ncbi:rab-like protein 3 isoform X2 [Saimiri boliviensis]|uniref:rab-like protein 3 isoform X2 n=1 Tax=Saimiri boliviensis TaxID=27679 RepID=UPI003D7779EE